jgi:hypothetical protein
LRVEALNGSPIWTCVPLLAGSGQPDSVTVITEACGPMPDTHPL